MLMNCIFGIIPDISGIVQLILICNQVTTHSQISYLQPFTGVLI